MESGGKRLERGGWVQTAIFEGARDAFLSYASPASTAQHILLIDWLLQARPAKFSNETWMLD